jgi:hypothetical protein
MYKSFYNGSVKGVTSWMVEDGHSMVRIPHIRRPSFEVSLISLVRLPGPSRLPTFQLAEPTLLRSITAQQDEAEHGGCCLGLKRLYSAFGYWRFRSPTPTFSADYDVVGDTGRVVQSELDNSTSIVVFPWMISGLGDTQAIIHQADFGFSSWRPPWDLVICYLNLSTPSSHYPTHLISYVTTIR